MKQGEAFKTNANDMELLAADGSVLDLFFYSLDQGES